jgi:hypothetical protein
LQKFAIGSLPAKQPCVSTLSSPFGGMAWHGLAPMVDELAVGCVVGVLGGVLGAAVGGALAGMMGTACA